jgi:hypothetical protein
MKNPIRFRTLMVAMATVVLLGFTACDKTEQEVTPQKQLKKETVNARFADEGRVRPD